MSILSPLFLVRICRSHWGCSQGLAQHLVSVTMPRKPTIPLPPMESRRDSDGQIPSGYLRVYSKLLWKSLCLIGKASIHRSCSMAIDGYSELPPRGCPKLLDPRKIHPDTVFLGEIWASLGWALE